MMVLTVCVILTVLNLYTISSIAHDRFQFNRKKIGNKVDARVRIVNGVATTTDLWPWMVSLRESYDDDTESLRGHFCGGTIIRSSKPAAILTAAHCVEWFDSMSSMDDWNIWIDINRDDVSFENDTEIMIIDTYNSYKMSSYAYHPDISYDPYYQNTAINDVGIVFIDNDLPSQPIIALNKNMESITNNDELIAIGYGWDSWDSKVMTETLEQTDLRYMNDTMCNIGIDKYFRENWDVTNYTLFLESINIEYGNVDQYPYNILQCEQCIICAIGDNTDSCNGDSGSPLIKGTNKDNAIQIGIVSYGFECNIQGVPAQYTDIAYYYDWIQKELNKSLQADNSDTAMKQNLFILSDLIVFILLMVLC